MCGAKKKNSQYQSRHARFEFLPAIDQNIKLKMDDGKMTITHLNRNRKELQQQSVDVTLDQTDVPFSKNISESSTSLTSKLLKNSLCHQAC